MGHCCLKKIDYMGGGENLLLKFDRYIKLNVPVSIKILNPNLSVFLLCEILQSMHKLIYFYVKTNKTKLFSVFIKPLLHVKHDCSMQLYRLHTAIGRAIR